MATSTGDLVKKVTKLEIGMVVKSSLLPVKSAAYLVTIGLGISLQMTFFKENIPGLAAYFDNSAVFFKTS